MKSLAETGPNAEQIRYWNEEAGPRWVAFRDRLDALIEPLGALALERAAAAPGERVLDVGCGCGQTSLALARQVGPQGRVTGIDLSAAMLEVAAGRARDAGLGQARFLAADAQTAELDPVDLVFSRFGVMFFADPVAAFANLRAALAPGGRLVFVCWQAIGANPWMLEPLLAMAKHVALPPPPAPGEPGPFSFGDAERVRGILRDAGFSRLRIEPAETELRLGGPGGIDEALDFVLRIGPASAALRDAAPDSVARVGEAVREVLAARARPDGVSMPAAVWLVTARP